ncbi:hypothetical protein AAF712_013518 [Marasmius tenuissimus]|uniref:Uncharacterized protein n=1 Tax=Marasmius tenuissimus TaxID=585030 RepID=A0ABR2ZEQ2_9AGAR
MKFSTSALAVLVAASTAVAQRAMVGFPTNGTDVQAGSDLLVMVARPVSPFSPSVHLNSVDKVILIPQNFQSSAEEVGIVLGFASCPDDAHTKCSQSTVGTSILYKGPYNPQFGGAWFLPPHENLTVKIPEDASKGFAQISLTQFSLIGASLNPFTNQNAINVNIV